MELRQFLPGGKGSNIIAGEQGVVYAVQMGSNDGGVRCFFADYFYHEEVRGTENTGKRNK